MKNILFGLVISLLVSANTFGQKSKWPDDVNINDIYLVTNTTHLFVNLNRKNIVAYFGKPIKVISQWDEINEKYYRNYVFSSGEVNFDDSMPYVDIKSNGCGIKFHTKKGFTKVINIGSNVADLKNAFPTSWKIHKRDRFGLGISTSKEKPLESFISFWLKNGHVTRIIISEDNS